jgi:type II secretion system protein G
LEINKYKMKKNFDKEIKNLRYKRSGFTLLELLIVISIIGLLTSISLFALQGARTQGRDSKRKADLEQIRTGLELYKADCNQYPANLPGVGSSLTGTCTGVTNTYIQSMPGDPSSVSSYYYNRVSTVTYNLCSHLEDPPTPAGSTSGCGSCNPSPCRYKVTSP